MRQVDAATFHAAVEEAEGLVVVDFYTQNCGPCRLMYPKVVEMANLFKVDGVTFLKMLCSRDNKEIGKAFKVRVAPTFVLLRDGEEVARMTGAHGESCRGARPVASPRGSYTATDPLLFSSLLFLAARSRRTPRAGQEAPLKSRRGFLFIIHFSHSKHISRRQRGRRGGAAAQPRGSLAYPVATSNATTPLARRGISVSPPQCGLRGWRSPWGGRRAAGTALASRGR